MSESKDPVKQLFHLWRKINAVTNGKSNGPGMTAVARGVVLLLGLAVAGPILWNALLAMPAGLVAILGLGLALRVALWYRRRR